MSNYPYIYTSNTTTGTGGAAISWGNSSNPWYGGIPSGSSATGTGGLSNTTMTYNPIQVTVDIKRCRNCNHAHLAEQPGCIDQDGWNTVFVAHCPCKEYLPKDNLEYLEYLDKKKESH